MAELDSDGERVSGFAAAGGIRSRPGRLWRPLLGLILGLILLAVLATGIDVGNVWEGVRSARLSWLAMALLTVLLTMAAKVARWRGLLPTSDSVGYASLARALLVGQLVNAVLPVRLGEAARFYTLSRDAGLSKATALGTIAAEKVYEVVFLLVSAGLTAALVSLPAWLHGSLVLTAGLGVVVFGAAAVLPDRRIEALGERFATWLPEGLAGRGCRVLKRAVAGLRSLRRPGAAGMACAWSAVIWALAVATNVLVFKAFNLSLSVGAGLFLLTLLHVGMVPPSSPARLGVFHAITVAGLGTFDVGREVALAYATVLHAVVYGPQLLLGGVALVWGSVRPGRER